MNNRVLLAQTDLVSFDAIGTVFHLRQTPGAVYARIAVEHGISAEPGALDTAFDTAFAEARSRRASATTSEIAERVFWLDVVTATFRSVGLTSPSPALFDSIWSAFALPETWQLTPDVIDVFQELRARGFSLALTSNFDSRLRTLLEELKLSSWFDCVAISSEVGSSKPNRAIFRFVERHLRRPPSAILHIGNDLMDDVHGARQAGWSAVMFSPSGHCKSETHSIEKLTDVLAYLPGSC